MIVRFFTNGVTDGHRSRGLKLSVRRGQQWHALLRRHVSSYVSRCRASTSWRRSARVLRCFCCWQEHSGWAGRWQVASLCAYRYYCCTGWATTDSMLTCRALIRSRSLVRTHMSLLRIIALCRLTPATAKVNRARLLYYVAEPNLAGLLRCFLVMSDTSCTIKVDPIYLHILFSVCYRISFLRLLKASAPL